MGNNKRVNSNTKGGETAVPTLAICFLEDPKTKRVVIKTCQSKQCSDEEVVLLVQTFLSARFPGKDLRILDALSSICVEVDINPDNNGEGKNTGANGGTE